MSLPQDSNGKGQFNGAYSINSAQYQVMEQERLRRLQEQHFQTTVSMRSRAQVLSKQTIQRKRALEQKKQAMARAEEDRRRKALEERRKSQQEATDRFRNAIYRNIRPLSGTTTTTTSTNSYSKSLKITPSTDCIHRINSAIGTNSILTKLNKTNKPQQVVMKDDKTSLVPKITHISKSTETNSGAHVMYSPPHLLPPSSSPLVPPPSTSTPVPPSLDDVLDSIRGNPKRTNTQFEEDSLSPIHIQPSFVIDTPTTAPPLSSDHTQPNKILFPVTPHTTSTNLPQHTPTLPHTTSNPHQVTPNIQNASQTTPNLPQTTPNLPQATPISDTLEESTISSTSSSLHDSLDTPPSSPDTASQVATPISTPPPTHQILDLSKVVSSSSPDTTPLQEEKRLVSILKKSSEVIDYSTNNSSTSTIINGSTTSILKRGGSCKSNNSATGKKVRFVDEFCKRGKKQSPKLLTQDGFLVVGGASSGSYSHAPSGSSSVSPKVRISLSHSQQLVTGSSGNNKTGSNKIVNNKIQHKNGLTHHPPPSILSPPTQNGDINHAPLQREAISPQLLTLPIDKTVLERTPTDEEINELWKHINSYLHHTKITSSTNNEDTPLREVSAPPLVRSIRCRNSHQPVKLWRRHSNTGLEPKQVPSPLSPPSLNDEEHRLMESIEVLNEKLKGRVVTTETLVGEGTKELKKINSSRSLTELPRNRVRYHPKTVLQTTPTSSILQYR